MLCLCRSPDVYVVHVNTDAIEVFQKLTYCVMEYLRSRTYAHWQSQVRYLPYGVLNVVSIDDFFIEPNLMETGCRVHLREPLRICEFTKEFLLCSYVEVFSLDLPIQVLWVDARSHLPVRLLNDYYRIDPCRKGINCDITNQQTYLWAYS